MDSLTARLSSMDLSGVRSKLSRTGGGKNNEEIDSMDEYL